MPRKNDFTEQTRFIFLDDNQWECFAEGCGKCHANCLHHIFGRGKNEGCEKSPLNASPMGNHECHLARHGYWTSDSGRRFLFAKTLRYLQGRDYVLTQEDNEFLEKYREEIIRLGIIELL